MQTETASMTLPEPRLAAAIDDVSDLLPSSFADETGLGQQDLKAGLGELINVALGFLGIVAVIIILFGGFKWMTAGGNDEKVGEAKRLIIAGIIGLAIILSAYAITTFVLQSLIDATT
jgi:heme/copper-type cytochrome/quinol oxidase subunit 2